MSTNQEHRHFTFKEFYNSGGQPVKLNEDHILGYRSQGGQPTGTFNETRLSWISEAETIIFPGLPEAMQTYAESQGFDNWISIGGKNDDEGPDPVQGKSSVPESGTSVRVAWDVAIAGGVNPEAGFRVYREKLGGAPAEILAIADGAISVDVLTLTLDGAVIRKSDRVYVDYDSGPGGIKRAVLPGQAATFYSFRIPNGSQQ